MKLASSIDAIVDDIEAGRCVAFVGAGISIEPPTSAPGWNEFIQRIVCCLLERCTHSEMEEAAQQTVVQSFARGTLKPEIVLQIIREKSGLSDVEFLTLIAPFTDLTPNANHYCLAQLVRRGLLKIIVTTNFDTCIEKAMHKSQVKYKVYSDTEGAAELLYRLSRPLPDGPVHIWKPHGTANSPMSVIMTLKEAAVTLPIEKARLLRQLAAMFRMLIVGYSGRDHDMMPVLRSIVARSQGVYWSLYDECAKTPQSDDLMEVASSAAVYINTQRTSILASIVHALRRDDPQAMDERFPTEPTSNAKDAIGEHLHSWAAAIAPERAADLVAEIIAATENTEVSELVGSSLLRRAAICHLRTPSAETLCRLVRRHIYLGEVWRQQATEAYLDESAQHAYEHVDWALRAIEMLGDGDCDCPELACLSEDDRLDAFRLLQDDFSRAGYLLGWLYLAKQDFKGAAKYFRRSHEMMCQHDKVWDVSPPLIGEGRALRLAGNLAEAGGLLVDVIYIASAEGDAISLAHALHEFAEFCVDVATQGMPGKRLIRFFRRRQWSHQWLAFAGIAAAQARDLYHSFGTSRSVEQSNDCCRRMPRSDTSEQLPSVETWLRAYPPGNLVKTLETAAALRATGNQMTHGFETIRKDYEFLIRLALLQDAVDRLRSYRLSIASLYEKYGRPHLAVLTYRELLASSDDPNVRSHLCEELTRICTRLGEPTPEEVERYRIKAVEGMERNTCEDKAELSEKITQRCCTLIEERRFEDAIRELKVALQMAEEGGHRLNQAYAMHNIGLAYHRAQMFAEAEHWYHRALRVEESLPERWLAEGGYSSDRVLLAATVSSLGMLYTKWNKYDLALPFLVESYHRYQMLESRQIETVHPWLNKIEAQLGTSEFDKRIAMIELQVGKKLGIRIGSDRALR